MATPIGSQVGEKVEAMRNAMVDFLFVRIGFIICLANAFGDNLRIALGVTSILAIAALHASRVFEEFAAKSASHDIVELLFDEFVTLFLNDFLFLLSNGTLPIET
jgi:hypothetical protein